MKKYNLSEIMKNAWARYRKYNAPYGKNREGKKIIIHTFASCLKAVWAQVKKATKATVEGIRRMHYSEYKTSYSSYKTVPGSYDKATKTIEVVVSSIRSSKIRNAAMSRLYCLCPRCHTYCYGACSV